MRLRVRKAPQQPVSGRRNRPSQAKRKHCEVEPSPARRRGKMQKNETGLFSTIKKFIRGNAVKVGTGMMFVCVVYYWIAAVIYLFHISPFLNSDFWKLSCFLYPSTQVEQDIPTKRSRIDCQSDSDLITSTPQTRGLSNKSVSRGCRKHPAKGSSSEFMLGRQYCGMFLNCHCLKAYMYLF